MCKESKLEKLQKEVLMANWPLVDIKIKILFSFLLFDSWVILDWIQNMNWRMNMLV